MTLAYLLTILFLCSCYSSAVKNHFEGTPNSPSGVTIKRCHQRSAVITWLPGGADSSSVNHYFVEYNTSFTPKEWIRVARANPNVLEARVPLSPYVNYTFRVIAENDQGESWPSDITERVCRTDPDIPDKNPANVHTDRSKPYWLIVKWDPMPETEHNGYGFAYVLSIKNMEHGITRSYLISDWRTNKKEIHCHCIYSPFEITIRARNVVGDSIQPPVKFFGYSGESKPVVWPRNFELVPERNVTATSAWFQWDPVDTSPYTMRGEFHGYMIKFWKAGDRPNTLREVRYYHQPSEYMTNEIKEDNNWVREKETAIVENLYPYSTIELEVVALNTFYESDSSNIITIITPQELPVLSNQPIG